MATSRVFYERMIFLMKKHFAAIDIGGTKIAVGIINDDKTVLSKECFPTNNDENGGDVAATLMAKSIKNQCEQIGITIDQLLGIGIVCAGPVNTIKGTVENPYTLPGWVGFPICEVLSHKTGLEVRLENDANGALMGELLLNNIQDKRVLVITFGTGIGVSFWDSSKIYRCKDSSHPELGHVIINLDGKKCYCGNNGCFEAQCSGTALNERSQGLNYISFDDLYDNKGNDSKVKDFLSILKREIKAGIWNLCEVFKPDVVILGGGFINKYFGFVNSAIEPISKGHQDFVGEFEIQKTTQSMDSALVGTLMMYSDEVNRKEL